jgi:hypothetical protein
MKQIEKLQQDILAATNQKLSFTKVSENTFSCQTEQPQKVVFFALRNKLKVSSKNKTVTVTL